MVLAIANMIKWPIYAMTLNGRETTESLLKMFRDIPPRAIVLFEEVDTIPQAQDRSAEVLVTETPEKTRMSSAPAPHFWTLGKLSTCW